MKNNTILSKLKVRKAALEDIDLVTSLLVGAAVWLKGKGLRQWDYYIEDLDGNLQEIMDSISNESTFLFYFDNIAIASVTLENDPNEWDLEIWENASRVNNVMYLHRLVTHRDYQGSGIGEMLLQWSESYAKENGSKVLRFDCLHSNKGLNAFYQRKYELKDVTVNYGCQHSKYEVLL
jgi:GNAT superfamily N-acetyltransferase